MEKLNGYLAILVRVDQSTRTLVKAASLEQAREAVNANWQNRNHPENVSSYVILNADGFVTQTIQPNADSNDDDAFGFKAEVAVAKPKREALSI